MPLVRLVQGQGVHAEWIAREEHRILPVANARVAAVRARSCDGDV